MSMLKRFTALALVLCMIFGVMPVSAFAEDETEPADAVVQMAEEVTEAANEMTTEAPTEEPTEAPTEAPTEVPTEAPTEAPTVLYLK